MGQDVLQPGPLARRPVRPGLVLEAGTRRFPILDLTSDSCLIEAPDSATLRGYADIFDGSRHLSPMPDRARRARGRLPALLVQAAHGVPRSTRRATTRAERGPGPVASIRRAARGRVAPGDCGWNPPGALP